ncbi:hypothetical protein [Halobacteriovorax marinus]|uniref:hypothetical protein n=1 Tax=Halobacteriovorax marinus TaxID=97084 RepID=UPI003A8E4FA7
MLKILSNYDWVLTVQLLFIITTSITVLFFKRLKKYDDYLVSLPFSLVLAVSLFNSENLISFIFYSEVLFNLSKIIYKNRYLLYSNRFFENIRYLLWAMLTFTYFVSFNTFNFNTVPKNVGVEFTFVTVLFVLLIFLMGLSALIRNSDYKDSLVESIGYGTLGVAVFSLKMLHVISDIADATPPRHHEVIDYLVLSLVFLASLLSWKFVRSECLIKLSSVIKTQVIISLFAVVIIAGNNTSLNFQIYSLFIVGLMISLDLVLRLLPTGRMKVILSFTSIVLLLGLGPKGHIFNVFRSIIDSNSQILFIISIAISTVVVSFIAGRVFDLSLQRKEA